MTDDSEGPKSHPCEPVRVLALLSVSPLALDRPRWRRATLWVFWRWKTLPCDPVKVWALQKAAVRACEGFGVEHASVRTCEGFGQIHKKIVPNLHRHARMTLFRPPKQAKKTPKNGNGA